MRNLSILCGNWVKQEIVLFESGVIWHSTYIARAAKSLVDTHQIFGQPAPIVVLNNICMDGVVTLKLVSKIGLTTDILFL